MHKLSVAVPSFLTALAIAGVLFFVADPLLGGDSLPVLRWLVAVGVVTFFYYGFDKVRSKGKGQRIPEWTLHWLALSGGVFGGWLGMSLFRHKTSAKHREFRWILAISTLAWVWLLWQSL